MILDLFRMTTLGPGWVELPASYAASLMEKGAGHKYIKRVPAGTTKSGKQRFRYFYHVAHGGGVHAEDHFVEGASFKHGDGHYHVTKSEGGHVEIKHDESGHTERLSKTALREKLAEHHKEALGKHHAAATKALADAKADGASPKQLARLEKRVGASRVNGKDAKARALFADHKSKSGEHHPWDPAERTPPKGKLSAVTAPARVAAVPADLAAAAYGGDRRRAKAATSGVEDKIESLSADLSKVETAANKAAIATALAKYREGYVSRFTAALRAKAGAKGGQAEVAAEDAMNSAHAWARAESDKIAAAFGASGEQFDLGRSLRG